MSRVVVTGANGLLGSEIIETFKTQYKDIIALVRKESDLSLLKNTQNIDIRYASLNDITLLDEIIQDNDLIINCAGFVSFSPQDKNLLYDTNKTGTKNIIDVCLSKKNIKFIHISSVAAIGQEKHKTTLDENSKWEDSEFISDYGHSKYLGELEVWRAFEEGLNGFIVNPSVILAEHNNKRSSNQLIHQIKKNSKYYPPGKLNCVDIRDVCTIIDKLHNKGVNHEKYIINGHSIDYKLFYELVSKKLDKRPPSQVIKPWMAKTYFYFDFLRNLFTGKKRAISKHLIKTLNRSFIYSSEKVINELDYTFYSLEESIDFVLKK